MLQNIRTLKVNQLFVLFTALFIHPLHDEIFAHGWNLVIIFLKSGMN